MEQRNLNKHIPVEAPTYEMSKVKGKLTNMKEARVMYFWGVKDVKGIVTAPEDSGSNSPN